MNVPSKFLIPPSVQQEYIQHENIDLFFFIIETKSVNVCDAEQDTRFQVLEYVMILCALKILPELFTMKL